MSLPHDEIYFPGLLTRAANQQDNRVFIGKMNNYEKDTSIRVLQLPLYATD